MSSQNHEVKLLKRFIKEALENSEKPKAACVLIFAEDGKILAVSRKNDPNDFGLPGGKVDYPESAEEGAARELFEETGLTATSLRLVFVHDEGKFETHTFVAEVSGEINTPEAGVIRWVTPDVLLKGMFGDYNRKLFNKLGI